MSGGNWPSPAGANPTPTAKPSKFVQSEFADDRAPQKLTITIYGSKDSGKSTQAFALPGKKFVLSFDHRSKDARDNSIHKGDQSIHVFNAAKKFNEFDLSTGDTSVEFILASLAWAETELKPDWVIIDGYERLEKIADAVMRHKHGCAFDGKVADWNYYSTRNAVVKAVWHRALEAARLGIVFGCYYKEKVLERTNGETSLSKKAPHWIDLVEQETNITIETLRVYSPVVKKFIYTAVVTCKKDWDGDIYGRIFGTGETFDLTDGKLLPWKERLVKVIALANANKLSIPAEPAASPPVKAVAPVTF
jgi:hypothetical protein